MAGLYDIQGMQNGVQAPPGLAELMGGPSAVTGGIAMQREADYRRNQAVQEQLNQMILEKNKRAEQEFLANADLRELEKQAGMETARATAKTIGRSKEAETGIKETEAQLKKGTVGSEIEAGNAKNRTEVINQNMKQAEQQVEDLYQRFGNRSDPAALAEAKKWLDDNKVPPTSKTYQTIMSSTSTDDLNARVKDTRDRMVNNIAAQRKMMEEAAKTDLENKGKLDVANATGSWHLAAARAYAEGRGKNETMGSMEAKNLQIAMGLGDKPESEWTQEERTAVEWAVRDAKKMWQKEQASDNPKLKSAYDMLAITKDPALKLRLEAQIKEEEAKFVSDLPAPVRKKWGGAQAPAGEKMITINGQQYIDLGNGKIKDPKTGRTGTVK